MKTVACVLVWLMAMGGLSAQVQLGAIHYPSDTLAKYRVSSIIELQQTLASSYTRRETPDSEPKKYRQLYFDSSGHYQAEQFFPEREEEPAPGGYAGYEEETTEEVLNERQQLIERRYLTNGQYRMSELFQYDERGNTIRVLEKTADTVYTKLAHRYDERNNLLLTIAPAYTEPMRWSMTYNQADQLISKRHFKASSKPYRLDSNAYDTRGNQTAFYAYETRDEELKLTEQYTWEYDSVNRKLKSIHHYGDELKQEAVTLYEYNTKGLLKRQQEFLNGELIKVKSWEFEFVE